MGFVRQPVLALASVTAVALGIATPAFGAVPSYASPAGETIKGTIYQITGRYSLTLADERGFNDNVSLRDGTVIAPTGLTLDAGQTVTITGHSAGKTFSADEIDVDPGSISSGQALLPAIDYAPYDGAAYPAYAFTYGLPGDQYYGYGGYYGGYPPSYYYPYGPNYSNGYRPQPAYPNRPAQPSYPAQPPGYRSTQPVGRRLPGSVRYPGNVAPRAAAPGDRPAPVRMSAPAVSRPARSQPESTTTVRTR